MRPLSAPARLAGAAVLLAASALGAGLALDRTPIAAAALSDPVARLIDLNSAPAAQLELLPRIGPALAARIIEDREARGPFRNLDDLQRVRGIGPITVQRLRGLAEAIPAD